MFCHNCGTKLPDGSAFCPNCGEAVYREDDTSSVKHSATHTRTVSGGRESGLTDTLETVYKIQIGASIISAAIFALLYLGLDLDLVFIWSVWWRSFTTLIVYVIICSAIQVVGIVIAANQLKGMFRSGQEMSRVLMFRELKDGETEQTKAVNAYIRKRRVTYLIVSNIPSVLAILAVVRHLFLAAKYMG